MAELLSGLLRSNSLQALYTHVQHHDAAAAFSNQQEIAVAAWCMSRKLSMRPAQE
jgi:hypothetical protein